MELTVEKKAELFDSFCDFVKNSIEERIESWKEENPEEEYEDEDANGAAVYRMVPTSDSEARQHLADDFIQSGEDVSNVDCFNFFELVIKHIYGF